MSRRMDREGVARHLAVAAYRAQDEREGQRLGREPAMWEPWSVRDGFIALGRAWWHRYYRLWVLRRLLPPYERADHARRVRLALAQSRACLRPRLP